MARLKERTIGKNAWSKRAIDIGIITFDRRIEIGDTSTKNREWYGSWIVESIRGDFKREE